MGGKRGGDTKLAALRRRYSKALELLPQRQEPSLATLAPGAVALSELPAARGCTLLGSRAVSGHRTVVVVRGC